MKSIHLSLIACASLFTTQVRADVFSSLRGPTERILSVVSGSHKKNQRDAEAVANLRHLAEQVTTALIAAWPQDTSPFPETFRARFTRFLVSHETALERLQASILTDTALDSLRIKPLVRKELFRFFMSDVRPEDIDLMVEFGFDEARLNTRIAALLPNMPTQAIFLDPFHGAYYTAEWGQFLLSRTNFNAETVIALAKIPIRIWQAAPHPRRVEFFRRHFGGYMEDSLRLERWIEFYSWHEDASFLIIEELLSRSETVRQQAMAFIRDHWFDIPHEAQEKFEFILGQNRVLATLEKVWPTRFLSLMDQLPENPDELLLVYLRKETTALELLALKQFATFERNAQIHYIAGASPLPIDRLAVAVREHIKSLWTENVVYNSPKYQYRDKEALAYWSLILARRFSIDLSDLRELVSDILAFRNPKDLDLIRELQILAGNSPGRPLTALARIELNPGAAMLAVSPGLEPKNARASANLLVKRGIPTAGERPHNVITFRSKCERETMH